MKYLKSYFSLSFFIVLAKTGAHTLFTERLFSCNDFTVGTLKGRSVLSEKEEEGCNASVSTFSQARAHNVPTRSHLYGAFLYIFTQGLHPSLAIKKTYFENIFNIVESKTGLISV